MARRVTSRTLIGRSAQVESLLAALDAATTGDSRIVLITGDAGIGKTRLVSEAIERAHEKGARAVIGGCVQLGEVSIAFAPLVEALRDLQNQLGDEDFDEVLGSGRPQLSALLSGDDEARSASGGLFEHLLGALTRLGARAPVLLVFEDLHWADASTRDLVAFLGRNLRNAAVTLVLTLRNDEIHRRHPLRPVLAGLERNERVERIDIGGLGRADVAQLLGEIEAGDLDDAQVDELAARSGGNPFYVEELVAAGRLTGGVPDTLAEVILARVELLSDDARRLLRAAAVIDDHVDDELLAAVTGTALEVVTAALREAVAEQVLVLDADTCRFRHALVREALYDDLLPGERTRLHVATAGILEAADHLPPHTRWAMLAYHWDAARDAPKAFQASVRAGLEAEKVYALADAAEQYERALAVMDQIDEPLRLAGMTAADLLLRTSDAVQATTRTNRAVDLAEAALREMGEDAPAEKRALVHERIGRSNWTQHHGAASIAAYEHAHALVADRPASQEKAFVLSARGQSLMVRALYREAIPVLEHAIRVAVETGAVDVEAHARCSYGPALFGAGQIEAGFAELDRALELSLSVGAAEHAARTYTNLSHSHYQDGRHEQGLAAGREALDYVVQVGHARHYGEAIAGNVIAALHCAGRWAEAAAIHDDPRIPNGDPYQELRWLPVLINTGRTEEARRLVQATLVNTAEADDVQFAGLGFLMAARLCVIDGKWDRGRRYVADALALIEQTDDHFFRAMAFALGLRLEAERLEATDARRDATEAASARTVAEDLHRRMHEATVEFAERGVSMFPEPAGWLATGDALFAQVSGAPDPDLWAAAEDAWRHAGQPFDEAAASAARADAVIRNGGDRDLAAALVRTALATAVTLGAKPLEAEIRGLARRARLDLAEGAVQRDGVASLDITPRELDVLRLVAQGRTNRQIGESLFISEKTASVHVTNLMRKLGVGSRVEAATVAVRNGMADAPE